jgi:glycosyltransferase involved in cell wall biosynthesis
MRIGFDARPLLGPRTGVGVWLEGLLRGLAAATDWRFVLCLPRRGGPLGLEDLSPRISVLPSPAPLPGTLWLTTLAGPALAGRVDAYVGSLGVLPRRLPVPAVLVVHDLTPRTRPRHHTAANRFCFNAYFEDSVTRADAVVCVSEATRRGVVAAVPGVGRAALVIGEGVDSFFAPPPAGASGDEIRRRFAAGRPYVVQIGTLEPRKGVATLLAAHETLLRGRWDAPDLVLAGRAGWGGRWLEKALAAHPARERVHLPGYVRREDARALLQHAAVVVVASEEEGFGLPLAEALACGAACVASDDAALVEVAAGAALHFMRRDPDALAAALERALGAERARLRAAAPQRAAALAWEPVVAAWQALLSRFRMRSDAPPRN